MTTVLTFRTVIYVFSCVSNVIFTCLVVQTAYEDVQDNAVVIFYSTVWTFIVWEHITVAHSRTFTSWRQTRIGYKDYVKNAVQLKFLHLIFTSSHLKLRKTARLQIRSGFFLIFYWTRKGIVFNICFNKLLNIFLFVSTFLVVGANYGFESKFVVIWL